MGACIVRFSALFAHMSEAIRINLILKVVGIVANGGWRNEHEPLSGYSCT